MSPVAGVSHPLLPATLVTLLKCKPDALIAIAVAAVIPVIVLIAPILVVPVIVLIAAVIILAIILIIAVHVVTLVPVLCVYASACHRD